MIGYQWVIATYALCLWLGFLIDCAINHHTVGYLTLGHNEIRDLTAETLFKVYTNTCIEPSLQPLSGEAFNYAAANVEIVHG